jgi:hypothetical protein
LQNGQDFVFGNGKIPYSRHMLERRWMQANALAHDKYKTPIVPFIQARNIHLRPKGLHRAMI